jgi:hypothetical protein
MAMPFSNERGFVRLDPFGQATTIRRNGCWRRHNAAFVIGKQPFFANPS